MPSIFTVVSAMRLRTSSRDSVELMILFIFWISIKYSI